jgi:ribulose-phosphate 3-epimerase
LSKKFEFYASTISDDPKLIFKHLAIFESQGISGIHFDVMDGIFVPRIGLYPELLKSIKNSTSLPIEAHLMLTNPDKYIVTFVEAGAQRILVHFESLEYPSKTLKLINRLGVESCIVLNPNTDFYALKEFISQVDAIMLMAINPGIPKHPFIPETLDKLRNLKNWLSLVKPEIKIGIDGGVTFENAKLLFEYGADWLICGSGTIFKPGANLIDNLSNLNDIFLS